MVFRALGAGLMFQDFGLVMSALALVIWNDYVVASIISLSCLPSLKVIRGKTFLGGNFLTILPFFTRQRTYIPN
jgi:hypothetical protein